jgi:hypothetical protein
MAYRGQSNTSWALMPTLYRRSRPPVRPEFELQRRREERARIKAAIFDNPAIESVLAGAKEMSDFQKEAIARHYGAPSALVDLTCEPEVAAVFASNGHSESEVGFIYAINLVELLSLSGASGCWATEGGYQLMLLPMGVTVIHYLAPNPPNPPIDETVTIRFDKGAWERARMTFTLVGVPSVPRINAQKGIFIAMAETADAPDARDMWHLVDIVSQKYFFRHTGGGYTPRNQEFRPDSLLPASDPIASMVGG